MGFLGDGLMGFEPHVDDPRVVKKANPASWVSIDQLRAARASLPDLAHRRFVANQWTERAGHWLPPGAWQACAGEPSFEDGEPVVIGVDIGGERSDSAVVWVTDDLRVGVEVLSGDRAVLEIADVVRELAARFTVRECCFDPWRAVAIAHVNGDPTDNALRNTIPLCRDCHRSATFPGV